MIMRVKVGLFDYFIYPRLLTTNCWSFGIVHNVHRKLYFINRPGYSFTSYPKGDLCIYFITILDSFYITEEKVVPPQHPGFLSEAD